MTAGVGYFPERYKDAAILPESFVMAKMYAFHLQKDYQHTETLKYLKSIQSTARI